MNARLSLGTVQLGLEYGIQQNGRPDLRQARELLETALSHGLTSFDTAQAYGDAEEILGGFLASTPNNERLEVVTKLAPDLFDFQPEHAWPDLALHGVEASLARLHVARLDACLLHNAVRIHEPAAIAALDAVRRRGYCRRIGVSTYTPAEAMKALEYPEIGLVQIPYNVLDDRLERIGFFDAARARNVQVYARSVLLQGLLAMPLDRFPARMEFARGTLEEFHEICNNLHLRPIEASLTAAMRHPGIDSVVFGTDNIAQLLEFIAIARDVSIVDPRDSFRDLASRTNERLVSPNLW